MCNRMGHGISHQPSAIEYAQRLERRCFGVPSATWIAAAMITSLLNDKDFAKCGVQRKRSFHSRKRGDRLAQPTTLILGDHILNPL